MKSDHTVLCSIVYKHKKHIQRQFLCLPIPDAILMKLCRIKMMNLHLIKRVCTFAGGGEEREDLTKVTSEWIENT